MKKNKVTSFLAIFVMIFGVVACQKPSKTDKSSLHFQISQASKEDDPPSAFFLVTNGEGKRTGSVNNIEERIHEIPDARYGVDIGVSESDYTHPPTVFFDFRPALQGDYVIDAFFVEASTYNFSLSTTDVDGTDTSPEKSNFEEFIPAGTKMRFEIVYENKPKAARTILKRK